MKREIFLITMASLTLALASIQCRGKEEDRSFERSDAAVNDAFLATKNVLRNAVESIDHAVDR